MTVTEAAVAVIVALLSGGTLRSLFLYVRDKRKAATPIAIEAEQVEVSAATLALMSKAFDEEREAWANRDLIRRERIAELEAELREARDQLTLAQRHLLEVSEQVARLSERLSDLADTERSES